MQENRRAMFESHRNRPLGFTTLVELEDSIDDVRGVLLVPDSLLGKDEYSRLFPVGLPQEAYDDVIYFFPLACEFACQNPNQSLDLIDGLVAFSATCDELLNREDLKVEVLTAFITCLDAWTSEFIVVHLGRDEMIAKGSPLAYADYVMNSTEVFALLASLARFEVDAHLAEHFVLHWNSRKRRGPANSGWFVDLCRRCAEDDLQWSTSLIDALASSRPSRLWHFRRLAEAAESLAIPSTYLQDTQQLLRIADEP